MKKLFLIVLISLVVLTSRTVTGQALAVETDTSSSTCLNPLGTMKADYASGNHGIVGDTSVHTGHDTVYSLGAGNAMQCFCKDDGQGIQTDWKKAGELSGDQIKVLESQGWTYIPDGSAWGLDQGPYLAKNTSYNCKPSNNGGGGGSSSSSSSSSSSNSDSKVLGASAVLGLANTGNIVFIYAVFIVWVFSSVLGLYLRKKGK